MNSSPFSYDGQEEEVRSIARYIWGVDSATAVNNKNYECVNQNFGHPKFWGRYLTHISNVSDGLTREEILFLHKKGIRVMPIYNNFRTAVGYRNGRVAAQNASYHAARLKFPKGTFIFANVERFFDVDEDWIIGWVDAMYVTGYKPGFYHDPKTGSFSEVYCTAVAKNKLVSEQSVLWSAEREYGITKEKNAPAYNPMKVPCKANVWGWQYGRDSTPCGIDTNLIDKRLYDGLW